MNILISGCSFTAPNNGWSSNFSKQDSEFIISNIAHPGAGNTYIRRQIQAEIFRKSRIDKNKKYDFVIIQWSTIDRWDYPISFTSENDTPLIKLNTYNDDWVEKVGYSRNGTSLEGKSSIFYKNLYSKYGQLLNTLDDIYYTQLFLENLGIPYLMFSIANFLTTEASFDTIQNIEKTRGDLQKQKINKLEIEKLMKYSEEADSLHIVKNKINWDKFIWSTDFKVDNIGDGFTEYLINKGESFGENSNHPNERQHTNFFNDVIYPRFISEIGSIYNKSTS